MRGVIFIFTVLAIVIPCQARTITVDDGGLADVGAIQSANAEPNVIQEWVARYNGPGNGDDLAHAIAVDSNDNIYITGCSFGSGTSDDYGTIKYSPDSNQPVWIARYDGPPSHGDIAYAMALDSDDNIYVTGVSVGSGDEFDYATVKYAPDSNLPAWVARYAGPENSVDYAQAIAVDSNDNAYVTGFIWFSGPHGDAATVKYSSDSNEPVWIARYNSMLSDYDLPQAIVTDSNGNIYVMGYTYSSVTNDDYITIKYSPESNEPVWIARYNGPGNGDDHASAIAVDSADNIYVTGHTQGSGTNDDYATIKYSPDSNQPVWVAIYKGPGNSSDRAHAMAVDSMDNIYVTGYSHSLATPADYLTIKYSPDSNQPVWVARYNGPSNGSDRAQAIAIDSDDNIYVTGGSWGSATSYDYVTIKYSSDSGQPIWVTRYNGPSNGTDMATAIVLDSDDNAYVTGYITGSGTDKDYTTIKYSQPCLVPLEAEVNIRPKTLNLRSKGRWITCYIWLPEDYNVADIDANSILLEDEVPAEGVWLGDEFAVAKFGRREVQEMLGEVETPSEVELVVSGELSDGTVFEGTDTIRVIDVGGGKNIEPPGKALKQVNRNRKRIRRP